MENSPIDQMNTPQQAPQQAFTSEATPAQKKSGKLLLVLVVLVAIVLLGIALLGKKVGTEETTIPATAQEETASDLTSLEAELDATVFEGVSEGL